MKRKMKIKSGTDDSKVWHDEKAQIEIATEKMSDNRFNETVVVMLESDENGAWGLVINKRLGTMPIALLIDPSLNLSLIHI